MLPPSSPPLRRLRVFISPLRPLLLSSLLPFLRLRRFLLSSLLLRQSRLSFRFAFALLLPLFPPPLLRPLQFLLLLLYYRQSNLRLCLSQESFHGTRQIP